MAIEIRRLAGALGAEITGIDLTDPGVDTAAIHEISLNTTRSSFPSNNSPPPI